MEWGSADAPRGIRSGGRQVREAGGPSPHHHTPLYARGRDCRQESRGKRRCSVPLRRGRRQRRSASLRGRKSNARARAPTDRAAGAARGERQGPAAVFWRVCGVLWGLGECTPSHGTRRPCVHLLVRVRVGRGGAAGVSVTSCFFCVCGAFSRSRSCTRRSCVSRAVFSRWRELCGELCGVAPSECGARCTGRASFCVLLCCALPRGSSRSAGPSSWRGGSARPCPAGLCISLV